jgi:hypothetical protein
MMASEYMLSIVLIIQGKLKFIFYVVLFIQVGYTHYFPGKEHSVVLNFSLTNDSPNCSWLPR